MRILKSTRARVFGLALVAAMGLATSVGVAQPDPYFIAGAAHRGALVDSARVVARVNARALSLEDVELRQALVALNNSVSKVKVTDQRAAFKAAVRDLALYDAAVARGLQPSSVDIDQYIQSIRSDFAAHPTSNAQLQSYLNGLGMTEDAFFTSAAARQRYGQALAITKLRQVISAANDPSAWISFAEQAAALARVEILDPAFK